ncbi:MAG: CRISPR system precrRNA processing endoribonuclease RAMP protein Cas6 [Bryobacterales bacterium]|nr:CRISPR system precrRNA processing endoribonuclease RAMP protein Cas6 [Bryobacterales bacterium]
MQTAGTFESPELDIGFYRLRFSPASAVPPERWTGSAWRGIFGWGLRRLVCTARDVECPACLLYHTCVYSYLFETPPPPGAEKMRKYTAAPHPFVLWPASSPSGDDYLLYFNLFGRANQMLAYVVQAFARGARYGIHPLRRPIELKDVEQQVPPGHGEWRSIVESDGRLRPQPAGMPVWPPAPRRVRVVLITPLRLRVQESYVGPEDFRFADLFSNLLRRCSLLMYFHGSRPLETDFAGLVERSRRVTIERADLRWQEWARYSNRQRQKMLMGGLMGSFEFDAVGLEPLWPYLWLGQYLHAGKGATMGLGRYALLPASNPESLPMGPGLHGAR